MAKIQKKGKKGAASNYITRQQALKKLQVSLADFRRLCILKGIYPRQPKNVKKANKGSTAPATFYYAKDIQYLLHEPLLAKFREYKAFAKKIKAALYKDEYSKARSLEINSKPEFSLDHIVKERYPTFVDALRDLDDALSMLFLFSKMPSDTLIKAQAVSDCQKLIAEFQAYVMKSRSLRKVFFSIKGIYYQAEIKGQTITWVVPYQFSQTVPTDVDFRVMLTFLEFYRTLMGFVNFRLYSELNLTYPPKLNASANGFQLDDTAAKFGDPTDADNTAATTLDEFKAVSQGDEEGEDSDIVTLRKIQEQSTQVESLQNLFSNHIFFLSRETPRYALEFMIRACGGQVSWDETVAPNPPYAETDERITHQVCDRPTVNNRILSRAYIQPQWVADCINARKLLRTNAYEPGQVLPPHLSPFVEAKEGDYVPDDTFASDTEQAQEGEDAVESESEDESAEKPGDAAVSTEDQEHERELQAEAAGMTFSEYQEKAKEVTKKRTKSKKRSAAEIEQEELKEMAQSMMTPKIKRLYTKMKYGEKKKEEEVAALEKKKKALKAKASKGKN